MSAATMRATLPSTAPSTAPAVPRVSLPIRRCGRTNAHRPHTYVAHPRSGIDIQCPGRGGARSVGELIAELPALAEVRGSGVTLHVLGVMAA